MKEMINLLSQLHQTSDSFSLMMENVLPNYHLIHILYLIDAEEMNQKKLANKLGMTEPALSMRLKLMEKDGLIEKVKGTKDKRYYLLQLTESAKKQLDESMSILEIKVPTFFSKLSTEEIEQLKNILKKLG